MSGCGVGSARGRVRHCALIQQRVNALAERANEGVLTGDEQTDYEALINAADFIAILKLKAERKLTSSTQQ